MKLEDIIEHINKTINIERRKSEINCDTRLIVHRKTIPTKINAYKEVQCIIWLVGTNIKYPLLTIKTTARLVTDTEKETIKEATESAVFGELCRLLTLGIFNKIVKGEFYGDEQIPNSSY
jgi:hypothetical protein